MLYKLQFSYSTFRILNQCIVAKKYFLFRLVTYYKLHSIPSKSVLGTTVNELVLPMTNYETNQASIENGYSEMNIYDLYHRMESNNVVLSFKGDVTSELMSSILQIIEQRMESMNEAPKLRKKVYNVLVECLQNLYHHIDEVPSKSDESSADKSAIFIISVNENKGYSITTGNYILSNRKDSFEKKLERINSLEINELKDLYKQVLNSDVRSEKGGGGLGMIDIARKTGKKLNYDFAPLNDEYSFFSLNINVEDKN